MFSKNSDGSYTDLSNGDILTRSQYQQREPLYKIVNPKNGFVGTSTRTNVVKSSTTKNFPYTGSTHKNYSFHPTQSSLLNKSLESLAQRHPSNNGFFTRLHVSTPSEDFIIQTSSYDDVGLMMEELENKIISLSTAYGATGGTSITRVSFVVRL